MAAFSNYTRGRQANCIQRRACVCVCVRKSPSIWCGVYSVESCLLCGLLMELYPSFRSHTCSPEAVVRMFIAHGFACTRSCRCWSNVWHICLKFWGTFCLYHLVKYSACMLQHTNIPTRVHNDWSYKHYNNTSIIFTCCPTHAHTPARTHHFRHVHTHQVELFGLICVLLKKTYKYYTYHTQIFSLWVLKMTLYFTEAFKQNCLFHFLA